MRTQLRNLIEQVITLEVELTETHARFGLPVRLPYEGATKGIVTPQLTRRQLPPPPSSVSCQLSDTETSDLSSPDDGDKTATVERKLPLPVPIKEELDRAVPAHRLLDNSAGKSKAELASRGGLANRQLPKRSGGLSNSSSVSCHCVALEYLFDKRHNCKQMIVAIFRITVWMNLATTPTPKIHRRNSGFLRIWVVDPSTIQSPNNQIWVPTRVAPR